MHLEIGALADADSALDLGPEHPTRAGLVKLDLTHDAGQITGVEIEPGWLHRGAEKLFEVRDYRGVLMLADRHDWQAPFSGELVVALACEKVLGLVPPARATVARTLLAEIARVHSHLGFLSWVGHCLADADLASTTRAVRDATRDLMLGLSGNRLHPMLNRLGGLAVDPSPEWLQRVAAWRHPVNSANGALAIAIGTEKFQQATDTGALSDEQVAAHGVSGPAVRALGLARDLRLSQPYLAYDQLDFGVDAHASNTPTAWGRFLQMSHEISQSLALIEQTLTILDSTSGPVSVPLSKIIKLPDAETWTSIEAPLGVAGVHLVSRGATTPWRLKLRTPTFANVSVLREVLVGCHVDDVAAVVASFGWTVGDLDK